MKISSLKIPAAILGLSLIPVAGFGAQPAATTPARLAAPLVLMRLQDAAKPGEATKLAPAKFAIDALPASGLPPASRA